MIKLIILSATIKKK